MIRRALCLFGAIGFFAPGVAKALDIEGFYGLSRPPSASFSAAVSGTTSSPDLFDSSIQMAGGDVLFNLGLLRLGAIIDTTFGKNTASQTAVGALGGISLGEGTVKVDLLGEAGGHRYGNFTSNPEIITSSSSSEWLAYLGLRPGVSVKLGGGPVFVGAWGFARWDLTKQDVPVTVGSANASGSYKLGGTTIGATLRLGLSF